MHRRAVFSTQVWERLALSIGPIAVLAASLISRTQAADNPAKDLQSKFEAAKASLAARDLASAESHYIEAVTLGLRQVARLSVSEGRLDEAGSHLDYALRLKPEDVETQVAMADVWFRRGDVNKAKAIAKSIVATEPDDARAHSLLGRAYMFEGDSADAIQELKASENLRSDFETSYFLGIAYLKAGKLDQASEWFQQLETNIGESAALHVLFGRAYLMTKFSQQAIPEFTRALKLDPKYPRAHGFLGYAYLEYYQEEGYPGAREEFEKELKLHPNEYRVLELLGIANVNLRDFSAAETDLVHAVRLRPQQPTPYLYLGETYAATNRFKSAVETLEKYVHLVGSPTDDKLREVSRAYYLLGQNLRRLGREEDASTAMAHSQQIREAKFKYDVKHIFDEKRGPADDRESHISDRIADALGAGSPEEKQATESMIQQGLASDQVPNMSVASGETKAARQYRSFVAEVLGSSYNDLGVMRAKSMKFAEAAEFFNQASAWRPDLPGLDRNWGLTCFRAERYGEAAQPLERQLRAHPEDAFVRQLLGLSYSMLEKDEEVVAVLRPFLEHPPNDPGLLLAWGTALVHTHQSGAAAGVFRLLLEQNVENPAVHLLVGKAYAQQEDYSGAISEFSIAFRLNPQLPEAHYYAGLVYLRQKQFEPATREFRAELGLHPSDPHAMYHLGYVLLLQGQAQESASMLRQAVKAMPDNEPAHFELGRALLQQGELNDAIGSLETAKRLAPDHDATYFQLSQAYRRAGRMQEAGEALSAYQKLIEANRLKKRKTLETDNP